MGDVSNVEPFKTSGYFRKPDPSVQHPHLSVCLSFPSLSTPHRKHNFPLSLSFSLLLNNRGPFFTLWVMAAKCHQLGLWDAEPAGTQHRKECLGVQKRTWHVQKKGGGRENGVLRRWETGSPSVH